MSVNPEVAAVFGVLSRFGCTRGPDKSEDKFPTFTTYALHYHRDTSVCNYDECWEKNPEGALTTIVDNSSICAIFYGQASKRGEFFTQYLHLYECIFIPCVSLSSLKHLTFSSPFFSFLHSQGFIKSLVYTMSKHGRLDLEPTYHALSFHLRKDDSGVEAFYVLDDAKGSSIFQVTPRWCLWELCSTVPGREQVLEITGRPFGGGVFCVNARSQTKTFFVVPKVFVEPVNGGYEKLDGFTI